MPTYADVVCRAKLYFRNRIEAIKKSVHSHDQKPKRAERTPTKHDKTRERPSHRHRNWNSLTFSKFRVTVGVTVCDGVTTLPRSLPGAQSGNSKGVRTGEVGGHVASSQGTRRPASSQVAWACLFQRRMTAHSVRISTSGQTSRIVSTLILETSSGRAWRSDCFVSESRSGETIQFYVEGGDRWSLVFANDNTLVGTAVKPDGNTYALSFTR